MVWKWSSLSAGRTLTRGYFGVLDFFKVFGLWNTTEVLTLSDFFGAAFFKAKAAFVAFALALAFGSAFALGSAFVFPVESRVSRQS